MRITRMKNSNASLREIGNVLKSASKVMVFPHINPDGDALGSATALCHAMRRMGAEAWVLMEEPVPEYLDFMDTSCCTEDMSAAEGRYISVCVDCGEEARFPGRAEAFRAGEKKICIDHHATSGSFGDIWYVDSGEAAAAQIIYDLIREMGEEPDRREAEALYVGLSTDTGSFRYSNTTARTHRIAAELLERGVDINDISVALYQNVSEKKVKLQAKILENMKIFAGGRGAAAYVTRGMMDEISADSDDAEGMVETLRDIRGVEMAAFFKEKEDCVKVSMRAKSYGDVASIAALFGGGGHKKAAGCTLRLPLEEAVKIITEKMKDYLENKG